MLKTEHSSDYNEHVVQPLLVNTFDFLEELCIMEGGEVDVEQHAECRQTLHDCHAHHWGNPHSFYQLLKATH